MIWANEALESLLGERPAAGKNISFYLPEIVGSELPRKASRTELDLKVGDRTQLIISSGLAGHGWIPRIFNRPEITVVKIFGS